MDAGAGIAAGIAVGTAPHRPSHIPFDGKRVIDSDDFIREPRLPRSLAGLARMVDAVVQQARDEGRTVTLALTGVDAEGKAVNLPATAVTGKPGYYVFTGVPVSQVRLHQRGVAGLGLARRGSAWQGLQCSG